MNYNISYVFRLVDQFTGGSVGMVAAMGRITNAARAMGGALAGLAAAGAMVSFFGGAVKAASSWEDRMANVARTADLTRGQMIEYGKDAMKLSVQLGTPVEKIADTMSRLASQGLRDQAMLKAFTELTTKAAVAWDDITPEEAGKSIGKFSQIWFGDLGPEATLKSVRDLGDVINELSNRSNFKAPQLLKYLDRVSPTFKQLGFSSAEASAFGGTVLATGVESGQLQGTRAEMTVRKLLEAATNPTKNQKKGLAGLGFTQESYQNMIKSLGPMDSMLQIIERMNSLDPMTRMASINNLVGTRQGAQFMQLAGNLNEFKRQLAIADDGYAKRFSQDASFMEWLKSTGKYGDMVQMLEQYGKILSRTNSLEREFQKRSDTLKFAVAQREAAWERFKITSGIPLLKPAADANRWMAGAIDSITDQIEANPNFGIGLTAALGAALAASLGTAIWAGLGASGGLLTRLAVGGIIGGGTLLLTVALVGAGAWIIANWQWFWDAISKPLDFKINWPSAPAWLMPLINFTNDQFAARDRELRAQEKYAQYGFEDDAYQSRWSMPSSIDALAKAQSDAARRAAAGNPFAQFPGTPQIDERSWFRRMLPDDPWNGGRGSTLDGATLAGAIPQSIAVNVTSDVKLTAGELSVRYTGPIAGDSKTPVNGEASRGSTMSTVGAASEAAAMSGVR